MLEWVKSINEISKDKGLEEISMQLVGETLASSKVEKTDSLWPRIEVRNVIENIDSKNLLEGIQSKMFNELGVYSNGEMFFGDLAEKYDGYYKEMSTDWPKTRQFLKRISKSYLGDAKWHKKDERQRSRRTRL